MTSKTDIKPTPLGSTLKPTSLMPSLDWGFHLGIWLVLVMKTPVEVGIRGY